MTDDWVFNESTKTAPLRPSLCRLILRDFCEMHAGSVEADGDGLLLKCAPEMLISYAAWRLPLIIFYILVFQDYQFLIDMIFQKACVYIVLRLKFKLFYKTNCHPL